MNSEFFAHLRADGEEDEGDDMGGVSKVKRAREMRGMKAGGEGDEGMWVGLR